jgi:DNA-directed RNA polymerase subunit RPC12/RpoP
MSTVANYPPAPHEVLPSAGTSVCAQCGAPAEALDKFCPACGASRPAAPAAEAKLVQTYFRCKNCGAEVAVDPDQRSYRCAFCDSTYVVEFTPEQTGRQPPDFVIGFSITLPQAQESFRRWLGDNSWFRPRDLAAAQVVDKLRGVYLPFWAFSMLAQSRWAASIGEYWYRTETYTTTENGRTVTHTRTVQETEWWDLAGRHHGYYSGYLVSGSRGLPQRDAATIQPFHLAALKRYEPYFLAGWSSEEYSTAREQALQSCQQEFQRREQAGVTGFLPGDTSARVQVQTEFSEIHSDLVLLPVYLLSYRYRDKVYRFLLNGQTGKASGEKPLSGWRIGVAVAGGLLAALAIFLLIHFFGR